MMIIAVSFTTSMTSTIEIEKYNDVKEDVIKLSEEIKLFYLENGYLPIDKSHTYDLSQIRIKIRIQMIVEIIIT